MKKYEKGNRWVAKELLGRDDGILFREPLPSPDDQWREVQLDEEDVRSFFSEVDYPDEDQKARMCEQVLSVLQNRIPRPDRWCAKRRLWVEAAKRKIRELLSLFLHLFQKEGR